LIGPWRIFGLNFDQSNETNLLKVIYNKEMEEVKELDAKLANIKDEYDQWSRIGRENRKEIQEFWREPFHVFDSVITSKLKYYQGEDDITTLERIVEKGKGDLRVTYDDKLLCTVLEADIFDIERWNNSIRGRFYANDDKHIQFVSCGHIDRVKFTPLRLEAVFKDLPPYPHPTWILHDVDGVYKSIGKALPRGIDQRKQYLVATVERQKKAMKKHLKRSQSFAPLAKIQKK
jgi:hypothetical protein